MKRTIATVSLLFAACARAGVVPQDRPPEQARASVERVVDGDTVIVRLEGARARVRLIGIDTPEIVKPGTPVQCYGPESSAEARRLLDRQDVLLVYDRERHDAFRRTLAYVIRARDGLFVNEELVARGFAMVLTVEPNIAREEILEAAERRARRSGLGLWRACRH